MKTVFQLLFFTIVSSSLFSQEYNSEQIPWYEPINIEGYIGSRLKFDRNLDKFKYTESGHYHFSSILFGGGAINFLGHQSWTNLPNGMAGDYSFNNDYLLSNYSKMYIASSGKIGIGTTEPLDALHIRRNRLNLYLESTGFGPSSQDYSTKIFFKGNNSAEPNANFFMGRVTVPNVGGRFGLTNGNKSMYVFKDKTFIGANYSDFINNSITSSSDADVFLLGNTEATKLHILDKIILSNSNFASNSKLYVNVGNQENAPDHGIYSTIRANKNGVNQIGIYSRLTHASSSGKKYGIYSSVPGGDDIWAAYFKGKTEVEGDFNIKGTKGSFVFHNAWQSQDDHWMCIVPKINNIHKFNVSLVFHESGELVKNINSPSEKAFSVHNSVWNDDVFRVYGDGKVYATEINVRLPGDFPDYVFDETYELMDIKSLEEYILENKKLPNMPSAKEVKEKGVDLGELNRLLVEKIEELTLHAIEQQKLIQELNERLLKIEAK